jgi:hypothetical protein
MALLDQAHTSPTPISAELVSKVIFNIVVEHIGRNFVLLNRLGVDGSRRENFQNKAGMASLVLLYSQGIPGLCHFLLRTKSSMSAISVCFSAYLFMVGVGAVQSPVAITRMETVWSVTHDA